VQSSPKQALRIGEEALRGLPVLIVDDNATNRRILEEVLQIWHMKPISVEDGRAALALMEKANADGKTFPLVLLDAQMPDMDGFEVAGKIKHNSRLANAVIIMLTSAGQSGDAARCREVGIDAYLSKPIKRTELLEAMKRVLGAQGVGLEKAPPDAAPASRESRKRLKILLAEDNRVNQAVATRLLEKRGHEVVLAETGKQALQRSAEEVFDIILMDVQMPEMDGLEATAAIRQRETIQGTHIPIIAMTAHAMVGDKERCLGAGMDAYISKPLQIKELFSAIEQLTPDLPVPADVPTR
jgi:CheY-like chemotaxis protein